MSEYDPARGRSEHQDPTANVKEPEMRCKAANPPESIHDHGAYRTDMPVRPCTWPRCDCKIDIVVGRYKEQGLPRR